MLLADFKKVKIEYMKLRDTDGVNALNLIINKLMLAGIEKKAQGQEMTDADTTQILQKAINELTEEKAGFEKAGRQEKVDSIQKQIETVSKYLPKMLSKEEIKEIICNLEDKSIAFVMKHFKTEYLGKVDMRLVGEVLKTL